MDFEWKCIYTQFKDYHQIISYVLIKNGIQSILVSKFEILNLYVQNLNM